jgi:hypothetical protein
MHCQRGQQPVPPCHWGLAYLIQLDPQGQVPIAVKNCSPVDLQLQRNGFIGSIKNFQDCETGELNPAYLQAMAKQ